MTEPVGQLVEGANYYRERRHYAEAWDPDGRGGATAACSAARIYSEAWHRRQQLLYQPHRPMKPLADLPLCKRCERKAAKR